MSQLPNDAYGRAITMQTDGVTDYYLAAGAVTYAFPAGTSQDAVYLSMAQQQNLALFNLARLDFILNKYTRDNQIQLIIMYEAAKAAALVTRAAYIAQLLTWVNGITAYAASYVANVQAQTDPSALPPLSWDASQVPADPAITMLAAIQIPN